MEEHRAHAIATGAFHSRRRAQNRHWLWARIEDQLLETFRNHPAVRGRIHALEREVEDGRIAPGRAARDLLRRFGVQGGQEP
jgi:LAO/AO transport system kinase